MKATLAGVPLLAVDTVGWRFTHGVQPYVRAFELHRRDAAEVLARSSGREVELYFERKKKTHRIRALTVLQVGPARHPKRVSVIVADRRWRWRNRLVVGAYNVPRRSGERRLVDGNLQRIPPQDDITFARYSLEKELGAWSAEAFVRDVMTQATDGFTFEGVTFAKALPVENVILRDPGDAAIARALAYVPSLTVWMDEDGTARCELTSSGREEKELRASGPPIVGPSLVELVDLSRVRPSAVEVYLQPEDECRFDALEGIVATTTDAKEPRVAENVIRLPDDITVNGQKILKGTWYPIGQALLDAWNNGDYPPEISVGGKTRRLPPLTFEVIRKLWLAPGGYNAYFEIAQQGNAIWRARWSAILTHYRQTYRLSRRWVDRCHSIQATRLAIVDPERGTRAPADVYADLCEIPTVLRIAKNRSDAPKIPVNRPAWPLGDTERLLMNGLVAESATLAIEDPDEFVFRVQYKPNGAHLNDVQVVLPSMMSAPELGEDGKLPECDPRAAAALYLLHRGRLAARHRFATVLTLGSASPHGLAGLYKVTVTPDDAKKLLPPEVAARVGACTGPVRQVFAGPDVTARFAWRDEDAQKIERAILEGGPRDEARLIDPTHVKNVAEAIAATVYAGLPDQWQGSRVTAWDPARKPHGRIGVVAHELDRKGRFVTSLDLSPDVQPINFHALLPESTRRFLFRQVQP